MSHISSCEAAQTPLSGSSSKEMASTGYLNAADAAALDQELMSTPGYSLEQLMELAGLSVAEAVYQVLSSPPIRKEKPKILLICGPGNNGGDGLVAARHLVFFGFECIVVYPKQSKKQHFVNLVQQCHDVEIPVLEDMPLDLTGFDAIVDAIFGFSFKGAPREPFASALQLMMEAQKTGVPVISVDVPSGWNVDEGDVTGMGFVPEVLISLTAPKESARGFSGRHFVGGRFLPPKLATKYNIRMPPYPGVHQVVEIDKESNAAGTSTTDQGGWEAEYAAYLQGKEVAMDDTISNVPSTEQTGEANSWEQQYADYCAEKESRLAEQDAKTIQDMKGKH